MADPLFNPLTHLERETLDASGELAGRYANYFSIGHNALEFVLDFGEMYNGRRERMHSRIVMNPSYAKELLRVLANSIHLFEEQFSEIPVMGEEAAEGGSTAH